MSAAVPWPVKRNTQDPFSGVDDGSFMVFVPAIMSVGLLFSVATLIRDAIRRTTGRTRERRLTLEAASTVNEILGRQVEHPSELGLLRRGSYWTGGVVGIGIGAGIAVAAIASYTAPAAEDRSGWLLALSMSASVVAAIIGAACVAVAVRWPAVPPWSMPMLRTLPLTHHPARRLQRPRRLLTDATIVAAVATAALTWLAKTQRTFLERIEAPVLDAVVDVGWIRHLESVDLFGNTIISIGSVVIIAISGFRCRVMALVYPAAFVVSWLSTTLLQELVERARPTGFGTVQSFPSGHMVQAVFIAGLLPTALAVLFRLRRRTVWVMRIVLAAFVVSTALIRMQRQDHWPSDTLGGAALGLVVVIGAHWVVAHTWWHQRCSSCQWSPHPEQEPWGRSIYGLSPRVARGIGTAGAAGAVGASAILFVATLTVGLPARQADDGLGPEISEPVQLGLAAIVGLAGLVAIKWRAPAAFVIAFCASGLGLMASIEYEPTTAFAITLLLLVPSVLLWLAWQHNATVGAIFALAVLTSSALTATALGSREIYAHYFGPTHPGSIAAALESDADWLWLGSVGPTEATIVAGGLPARTAVTLTHWSDTDAARRVGAMTDADGIARFELDQLPPGTDQHYAVRIGAGSTPVEEADRSFRTFEVGAQDLVVIAGSCARTGSNGAVFDRIVDAGPDLFVSMGDMHYASLESANPDDHLAQYAKALTNPGQGALYGSVPTAYVWDDHDYGPNDGDSTSPAREAVSTVYRQAVPHYGVEADPAASIAQAFSVGRVRFVLTDTRSQRTGETMLGASQLEWLIAELQHASRTHALVVWVNPTPWISAADDSGDDWSNYPAERRRIADALVSADVDNLVMVSGDAHMVAIDDGSNSGYASDGSPGFPVLHAAALDRPGGTKGGPYSHGAITGSGQFGRIEITDDGGAVVSVRLSGHNWEDEELLSYEFDVAVDLSEDALAS